MALEKTQVNKKYYIYRLNRENLSILGLCDFCSFAINGSKKWHNPYWKSWKQQQQQSRIKLEKVSSKLSFAYNLYIIIK